MRKDRARILGAVRAHHARATGRPPESLPTWECSACGDEFPIQCQPFGRCADGWLCKPCAKARETGGEA